MSIIFPAKPYYNSNILRSKIFRKCIAIFKNLYLLRFVYGLFVNFKKMPIYQSNFEKFISVLPIGRLTIIPSSAMVQLSKISSNPLEKNFLATYPSGDGDK